MLLPLVYHPQHDVPWPPEHRFPMPKFRLLYELLLREGVAVPEQFHQPQVPALELFTSAHTLEYITAFMQGTLDERAWRRVGLLWSEALVRRTLIAAAGTLLTAELALEYGLACHTAGGTHHAFESYGAGFCVVNDLAIVAKTLLQRGLVQKLLIVDLDVHQGDGTAWILRTEPRAFTFSMHCEANFPFHKQQSDLDVNLSKGIEDSEYLRILESYVPDLLDQEQPDIVLYDAGVDPHVLDPLGHLCLTSSGLLERDKRVLRACLSRGIPVACVIGGGYSRDLHELAQRHSLIHRAATQMFQDFRL